VDKGRQSFWPSDLQSALNSANGLNLCGFTDWRLPNVNELRSVVDYSNYDPALPDSAPFINVQSDYYWSSTSNAFNAVNAWSIHMYSGYVYFYDKTYTYNYYYYYVWPVRGGQSGDSLIAPSKLKAKANSSRIIVLRWKDNSDNETSFKIYRKAGTGHLLF